MPERGKIKIDMQEILPGKNVFYIKSCSLIKLFIDTISNNKV